MNQLTIDVGGTFTDCLVLEDGGQLHRFKASTTPDDPTRGFFDAALKAAAHYGQTLDKFLGDVEQIIHGTTLGTNILITERGAKVGMITTKGFRDVLEMGRRDRPQLFGLTGEFHPLISRDHRLEVTERMDARGNVLEALDEEEVAKAAKQLRAILENMWHNRFR